MVNNTHYFYKPFHTVIELIQDNMATNKVNIDLFVTPNSIIVTIDKKEIATVTIVISTQSHTRKNFRLRIFAIIIATIRLTIKPIKTNMIHLLMCLQSLAQQVASMFYQATSRHSHMNKFHSRIA